MHKPRMPDLFRGSEKAFAWGQGLKTEAVLGHGEGTLFLSYQHQENLVHTLSVYSLYAIDTYIHTRIHIYI